MIKEEIIKCKNDAGLGRITQAEADFKLKCLYDIDEMTIASLTDWQKSLQFYKKVYDNLQNELYIAVKSRQK